MLHLDMAAYANPDILEDLMLDRLREGGQQASGGRLGGGAGGGGSR